MACERSAIGCVVSEHKFDVLVLCERKVKSTGECAFDNVRRLSGVKNGKTGEEVRLGERASESPV